ncbi:peptide deformylase [Nannochloropsis gaditana]|uniref:Peptide deformylase n=1 Tax=Nannochloropsis gaditana TaxID=72520 RepID=W7U6W2_9STRA|nr:peptide deformylase [Nannochloropsis gaditana]
MLRPRAGVSMAAVATTATLFFLGRARASPLVAQAAFHAPRGSPSSYSPAGATLVSRGIRTRSGPGSAIANSIRHAWGTLLRSTMVEEVDPGEVEGTDLRVLKYPDPRLRAANAEITEFGPEVAALAKDMFKVMYAMNGVGLAAPQVGVNQRLMVFNPQGDRLKWLNEVILCNPAIVEKSGKTDIMEEGCLSFPGMAGDVERSLTIKVTFQNAKGKKFTKKFRDWEARIFQHEYDHLDGVLYMDRLVPESKQKVQPVLDKLVSDFGPGGAL